MARERDPWQATTPFTAERIGALAIYCSDGRYGEQFDEFLHHHLALPRYDRLAVPGGAAALAGHLVAHREQAALLEDIQFLVETHALECVVLIAHQGCGFYLKKVRVPATELRARQEEDLAKAAEAIRAVSTRLAVAAFFATVEGSTVSLETVPC